MPINAFDGDTFVSYIDISGFKSLMQDETKALKALDKLYQCGYETIMTQNGENRVEGIFVSDCGIMFIRQNEHQTSKLSCLKSLLAAIKIINKTMVESDLMLTTAIAYGRFIYRDRIEIGGITKSPIYGNAYVSAFLDNEKGNPKIEPGYCRILKQNLPDCINEAIDNSNDKILRMIRGKDGDKDHYYYYWMAERPTEIKSFEQKYQDAYHLKNKEMLRALKGENY